MKRFTISNLLMLAAIIALLITWQRERTTRVAAESLAEDVVQNGLVRFTSPVEGLVLSAEHNPTSISGRIYFPKDQRLRQPTVMCAILRSDGSLVEPARAGVLIADKEVGHYTFQAGIRVDDFRPGIYIARVEFLDRDKQIVVSANPFLVRQFVP